MASGSVCPSAGLACHVTTSSWPWVPYVIPPPPRSFLDYVLLVRSSDELCVAPSSLVFFIWPGLDAKYGTVLKYVQHCGQPQNAQEHRGFLLALEKWFNMRSEGSVRVRTKEELEKAKTYLTEERSAGQKLKKPKLQFVDVNHWDEALYGKLDRSKIEVETIAGQEVRGVWRMIGKEGHYDLQTYEDHRLQKSTCLAENAGPFGTRRLQAREEAVTEALRASSKSRFSAAVLAPEPTATEILALLDGLQAASSSSGGPPRAEKGEDAEPLAIEDEQGNVEANDSSEASDVDVRERLLGTFAKAAKAKAKSGAAPRGGSAASARGVSSSAGGGAPRSGGGGAPHRGAAGGAPRSSGGAPHAGAAGGAPRGGGGAPHAGGGAPPSAPHGAPGGQYETAELDGRFQRLRAGVAKDLADVEEALHGVEFDGSEPHSVFTKTGWSALQAQGTHGVRSVLLATAKLRAVEKRFQRSRNTGALAAEVTKVEELLDLCALLADFQKCLRGKSHEVLDTTVYLESFERLRSLGFAFGAPYHLLYLRCAVARHIMYKDYDAVAKAFFSSSPEVVVDSEGLLLVFDTCLLGALKLALASKEGAGARRDAADLLTALWDACGQTDFPYRASMSTTACLLVHAEVSVSALAAALSSFDTYVEEGTKKWPLFEFLSTTAEGKDLLGAVRAGLQRRQAETEWQKELDDLKKQQHEFFSSLPVVRPAEDEDSAAVRPAEGEGSGSVVRPADEDSAAVRPAEGEGSGSVVRPAGENSAVVRPAEGEGSGSAVRPAGEGEDSAVVRPAEGDVSSFTRFVGDAVLPLLQKAADLSARVKKGGKQYDRMRSEVSKVASDVRSALLSHTEQLLSAALKRSLRTALSGLDALEGKLQRGEKQPTEDSCRCRA